MPTICMFLGIIIRMFYDEHQPPHFHAEYQGREALFSMDGTMIKGFEFPVKQQKLITAWALMHEEELIANWELGRNGEAFFRIEPLR